jgi:antitoxin ParD1/3/4
MRAFIPIIGTKESAMAKNTSVSLGDHFEEFIAEQVDSGRYGSASEVVRAGLRLLETNESKLEVLRNALIAGERSGRAKYSYESLVAELDAEQK